MKFCCAEKKLFFIGWLCMNGKSRLFRKTKTFSFAKNVSKCTQKPPFCTNLKLSFCTSPFLSPPKATLFHHKHSKFAPSHNLLSIKERGCSFAVRSKSLRCNAGTSHRFKAFSPPFCAKNRVRLVLPENSAKIFSGRALNRGRRTESRVLFMLLFAQCKK